MDRKFVFGGNGNALRGDEHEESDGTFKGCG